MIKKIKNKILDLIFPTECVICGKSGQYFCESCFNQIKYVKEGTCLLCNTNQAIIGVCANCQTKSYIDDIIAVTKYKDTVIEQVIHELKFSYIEQLANQLANLLSLKLKALGYQTKLKDKILIPLPLHKKRFLERGFNQSELLLKLLQPDFDGQIRNDILKRVKYTSQQAKLDREQRINNVQDAFKCLKPDEAAGQKIFLLDDVLTSGATMNQAAKALKSAGAKKVIGLVIAHG